MNAKNSVSEIKALDERGRGVLVFATLNAIDKESDVTLPGAFGEQDVPIVPAHDWTGPPIGKAKIYETHNEGRADFALNLETRDGRNWFEAIKFDLAYPPATQEYSYGFTPTVFDFGEMNGRKVRFLRRVKVHEVSPVLLVAGVNTRTIELRDHGPGSTKRGTSMQHPPVFDPYRAEKKLEHVRAYLLESKFRQFEWNTAEAAQVKYREVNVDLWMLDATYLLSHLCSEELGVKAAGMRFFRKALPSDQVAFTFPSDVLWGLASPIERRIWIREDRRGTNLIRAVAHEMRHLAQPLATDKDSRALDEDDAESYADDFSSRFGRVPTSARLYVNLFEKKRLNAIEPDAPAGSGLINVVDGWLYARDSYGWRKIRRWKKEN